MPIEPIKSSERKVKGNLRVEIQKTDLPQTVGLLLSFTSPEGTVWVEWPEVICGVGDGVDITGVEMGFVTGLLLEVNCAKAALPRKEET